VDTLIKVLLFCLSHRRVGWKESDRGGELDLKDDEMSWWGLLTRNGLVMYERYFAASSEALTQYEHKG
jgi:hypothetical protein